MPNGNLSSDEIKLLKTVIYKEVSEGSIFILGGSLSDYMPADLYVQLIQMLADKNVKIIVDTSGKALETTL